MREIKFNFVYGIDGEVEKYFTRSFTFAEIEGGDHFDQICDGPLMEDYRILAKRQWTGLKDRNGVEIYEGDILVCDYHDSGQGDIKLKGAVAWVPSSCLYSCGEGTADAFHVGTIYTDKTVIDNYLVIGNIHQHPHLLTEAP